MLKLLNIIMSLVIPLEIVWKLFRNVLEKLGAMLA